MSSSPLPHEQQRFQMRHGFDAIEQELEDVFGQLFRFHRREE
jgi:hypothetical protein